MDYLVNPKENFSLEVTIPGSKSISNRALILAALSGKKCILRNFLLSDDTIYMIEGLKKLGNIIEFSENNNELTVIGNNKRVFDNVSVYTGNAGTMMRFLSSYIATGFGTVTLSGNSRMNERPIRDLVDSLEELGVKIQYLENTGYPPISLSVNSNNFSDSVKVKGDKSSQYLSSLLMAAPYFKNGLKIELQSHLVSRPYIDMTLSMMSEFGVKVKEDKIENCFYIPCGKYELDNYLIEGDMSSASYFLAMALVTNSTIKINNYFKNSIQGDKKFLEIFLNLGGRILNETPNSITVSGVENYKGIDIDLNDSPDIAQTLAVVALFAKTPTTVTNVANMRIKETDRITALKNEILKLGGEFIEREDSFTIIPKPSYKGVTVETYDDHRMAMSFSLAGLKIPGVIIKECNCVSKTFPDYFKIFNKIYEV